MQAALSLQGFIDELMKIAAFNTRGLSPETVLEKSQPPPPMETAGFDKARAVLDRAAQIKMASVDVKYRQAGSLTTPKDSSTAESAKSVGGYSLAGGGAGKMLSDFAHGPALHPPEKFRKAVHKGTGVGLAAGALYGLHRAHQRNKAKKATMVKTSEKADVPYSKGEQAAHLGAAGLFIGGAAKNAYDLLKRREQSKAGIALPLAGSALMAGVALKRHLQGKRMAPSSIREKTATLSSPGQALKASTQVGKAKVSPSSAGPKINTQIRGQLIGKKGIP